MNYTFIIILFVITLLMSFKNFQKGKQYKRNKGYIDVYTKVLRGSENAYEELSSYIEKESDPTLKTKAMLVKINEDLGNKEVNEELNNIDIKNIFFDKEFFSNEKTDLNSEAFLWLILILSKASSLGLIDVMKTTYDKVNEYDEILKNRVEYQVFKSTYFVLTNKESLEFLKSLLAGEYSGYTYDKNLIGIYKKVAACLLAYLKEDLDESDKLLINSFVTTLIGSRFTKDLGIYDEYKVEEDIKEEDTEEIIDKTINDDNKEEIKEDKTEEQ